MKRQQEQKKQIKLKVNTFPLIHLLGSDDEKIALYRDWRCPQNILSEAFKEWVDNTDSRGIKFKESIASNPNLTAEQAFTLSQDKVLSISSTALANINHPTFHRKILEALHSQCLLALFDSIDKSMEMYIKEGCFLTGGSLVSLIRRATPSLSYDNNDNVKDFDFYFHKEESLIKVINHFLNNFIPLEQSENFSYPGVLHLEKNQDGFEISELKKGGFLIGQYKLNNKITLVITNNAITLKRGTLRSNQAGPDFQFIFKVFNESPEETVKAFDFVHCQGIINLANGKILISPEAYNSMICKKLIFKGGMNPLSALIRMQKLIKKKWHINRIQMIKILAFAAHKVDFSDVKSLKEHLKGFYYESQYPEINNWPEDKISLEELFELVDELSYY